MKIASPNQIIIISCHILKSLKKLQFHTRFEIFIVTFCECAIFFILNLTFFCRFCFCCCCTFAFTSSVKFLNVYVFCSVSLFHYFAAADVNNYSRWSNVSEWAIKKRSKVWNESICKLSLQLLVVYACMHVMTQLTMCIATEECGK